MSEHSQSTRLSTPSDSNADASDEQRKSVRSSPDKAEGHSDSSNAAKKQERRGPSSKARSTPKTTRVTSLIGFQRSVRAVIKKRAEIVGAKLRRSARLSKAPSPTRVQKTIRANPEEGRKKLERAVTNARTSPKASPTSSRTGVGKPVRKDNSAKKEPLAAENEALKQELAEVKALLAREQALLQKAEQTISRVIKATEKSLASAHDTYPYRFWPPLPWDSEPARRVSPPHIWRRYNKQPVQQPHEDILSYSIKVNRYSNAEAENARLWLGEGTHLWPPQDESVWRGVKFLGAGSYGSVGLWVKVDGDDNIVDVSYKSYS
jgi:hypothetical protein